MLVRQLNIGFKITVVISAIGISSSGWIDKKCKVL